MVKTSSPFSICGIKSTIRWSILYLISSLTLLSGCEQTYQPKQVGYNRIDLPAQTYQGFDGAGYPFRFDHSTAATVLPDHSKNAEPFWVNIHYPAFGADVQITYKALNGNQPLLHEYIEEVRLLTNKHNIKATQISEHLYKTADNHSAYVFLLGGQVPTQFQFYATDSAQHFIRGALYFRMADRNDSLQPVIDFISQDMEHLLSTLRFKNK